MNFVVSVLGKKALGRLKDKHIEVNSENPYMEKVPVHNRRGEIVKYKERERPIPAGLSANDEKILRRVRRKAYSWDLSFRFCCFRTRFGWSFFVGLLPFIGDFADLLVAMHIMKIASAVDGGLPKSLYAKMMWNVMIDFGIGLVPFLGDLADALYRANVRNAWLLDAYLSEKANALQSGKVEDPDSGKTVAVPNSLRHAAPGGHPDLETGTTQAPPPTYDSSRRGRNGL
ncbi:hypothetical protein QBC47DRAFT_309140 [Echria macrotheca]|uniref:PH domain-containing protein n=1 Tax=Echria macrotheca TaxID=438768 RepID=A0AAJ0F700_9PEZI|nr:hypothetical protein QBC47DRAFT_309140 [Echria macrotheca]